MKTLSEVRKGLGMSMILVAGMARVSPGLYSYAEKGRFTLTVAQAKRIAKVLDVACADVAELNQAVGFGSNPAPTRDTDA